MDKRLKLLGKIIKEGRRKKRITQIELADRIYLSVPYVKDLERGRAMPSTTTIFELIKCLNIDVMPFFYDIQVDDSLHNELLRLLDMCNEADYRILIATATAMVDEKPSVKSREAQQTMPANSI